MAVFKFVISEKGKGYQIEKDQKDAPVLGKKIGDKISGDFLGLAGYDLEVTGGSDKDGFPMRRDIEGVVRRRIIITKGIGLHTDVEGLRRRKMLRGNTIAADVSQINCKVVKAGEKTLEDIFGKKENKAEGKEEAKKEESAEAKKEEAKEEAAPVSA
jgi:small subunit ribosomal protein S6e